MIDPTDADIGRAVVYRPFPEAPPDEGVITRVTESYVFVRYRSSLTPMATNRRALEWVSPSPATLTEAERWAIRI